MSVSTQVMIISSSRNGAAISWVNDELQRRDVERRQQLAPLSTDLAGGTQPFGLYVWAAAFNYVSPYLIQELVCEADWAIPEQVFVIEASHDYEVHPRSSTVAELRDELRGSDGSEPRAVSP
jgi:hypothetical protein